MDALSDALSTLRVASVLSSRFEGSGAWALHFPAYRHIKLGGLLSGRLHLWIEGAQPTVLEAGDFYLLSGGRPFCTASDPRCQPEDGTAVYRSRRGEDRVVRHHCAGVGAPVCLAGGQFTFENDVTDLLLRHLPPLIHLRRADIRLGALPRVLDLLRLETGDLYAGAEVARASLAALALVHVLRAYLASRPQAPGWLGALADPRIGQVLSMLHAHPARPWTLEALAGEAAMSRTAFASHFRSLIGEPPMAYLQRWRMTLACTALRSSQAPLTKIAEQVGYLSATAFSIAFKRSMGVSPGRFRAAARKAAAPALAGPPDAG